MKKSLVGNCLSFQNISEICFSLTGTYFKTQSKLTHFIKSMFQKHEIVGPHIWLSYTQASLNYIFYFFLNKFPYIVMEN